MFTLYFVSRLHVSLQDCPNLAGYTSSPMHIYTSLWTSVGQYVLRFLANSALRVSGGVIKYRPLSCYILYCI